MSFLNSFQATLQNVLTKRGYEFENKTISSHWNVALVKKDGNLYIAKQVHTKSGFENEVRVYNLLPEWWPVKMVDNMESEFTFENKKTRLRIIVTTYFEHNADWKTTLLSQNTIGELCTQLDFLHDLNIAHRDSIHKNIMLNKNGHCALIDFEKARQLPYNPSNNINSQSQSESNTDEEPENYTFFDDYYQFYTDFIIYDSSGSHFPSINSNAYKNMATVQKTLKNKFSVSDYADKTQYKYMYIQFGGSKQRVRYGNKTYMVKYDKAKKFITVQKQSIYLGTIRGKYVYV